MSRFNRKQDRSAVYGLSLALAMAVALAVPSMAAETGDESASEKAEPTRSVVMGKATLNWHLNAPAAAKSAQFATDFRDASKAHLLGEEAFVSKRAEPTVLPGGQLMLRLPAELIHSMFVKPDGSPYCSDSTVTEKATEISNADGEVE